MSILYQEGFDPALIARQEAIFHTANGYVGVRASLEEGVPEGVKSIRGTYLNGFYNLRPIAYGEKLYGFPDEQEVMPGVADAQTIRLNVGDELFSPFTGTLEHYSRTLDMDAGVSTRNITWRTEKGATV
ncbi:MAG: family 65 glycosyl hydrolase, partial [Christensenellaceae bacterium]|nr:family 65 glycosyl hydrolase [Christensenellaceae bacterium]